MDPGRTCIKSLDISLLGKSLDAGTLEFHAHRSLGLFQRLHSTLPWPLSPDAMPWYQCVHYYAPGVTKRPPLARGVQRLDVQARVCTNMDICLLTFQDQVRSGERGIQKEERGDICVSGTKKLCLHLLSFSYKTPKN